MSISFDGATKLAVLSAGTTTLDLADLWSRWKDWVLADNAGWVRAMDTVGGEPIDPSVGTLVPLYLFLLNGWKIKPQEANHTLNVVNGILLVSGGGDPFVNTSGSYVVRIRYQQPVQAIGYSTTGSTAPTTGEIVTAIEAAIIPVNVEQINGTTVQGTGTDQDPWR